MQDPVALPSQANKNVLKLFETDNGIVAITPTDYLLHSGDKWENRLLKEVCTMAVQDADNRIWVVSQNSVWCPDGNQGKEIPLPDGMDAPRCVYWGHNGILYIGTAFGLYYWDGGWHVAEQLNGICVNDIVSDAAKRLYVATTNGLWRKDQDRWVNLDDTVMPIGNDRKYFAVAVGNHGKDVFFSTPHSIACIAADGYHHAWSAADGLPYGPAQLIRVNEDGFWLGTAKGAIKKDASWRYYHGKRWLNNSHINDILILKNGAIWIATPDGINEIKKIKMTLAQKADIYERNIALRHNRRGLINVSHLTVPGDLNTSYTRNEDNDGLWTSCYLAAECFRYGVTKSPEAKALAVRTFEALERLEAVTGISGYPARSYALASDTVVQSRSPHPKHWHLSPDGKWQWLDDTSSDEITGHLFALTVFHELVADEQQKRRVTRLMNRILTHITDNNFHLIDIDGKPTRWGVWNPDSLNHSPNWMTERGLNSLQILSHLKTAGHYTSNPKFEAAYQTLVGKHGYAQNALQAKMYGAFQVSHSDDILNFFPYYGLLRFSVDDPNYDLYRKSLERSWNAVRNDHMPVWNIIASALLQKDCDLDIALKQLQDYPVDLVDWTMENSHRWDFQREPVLQRYRSAQSTRPVPTTESSVSRWNTNPKILDSGNGGKTEETGSYFLFAYWMGRYYGFF